MAKATNWTSVSESKYPWERDALDFVRQQFPFHDPYRAWANFEFIADDGSINEVDLLVFTPQGFFLIEIKSRPGRLFGDAGTWTWETDGKLRAVDNPLLAANLKAKKLRSLLQRQKAFKKKGQPPFVEALLFCSAPELRNELQGNARFRVCLRDRDAAGETTERKGIMAAIAAARAAGQAVATAHFADHSMGALLYALKALEAAGHESCDELQSRLAKLPGRLREPVESGVAVRLSKLGIQATKARSDHQPATTDVECGE